jgi:hypothetical protein
MRALNEAQRNAVDWDKGEGKGKSTITIATKFGSKVKNRLQCFCLTNR